MGFVACLQHGDVTGHSTLYLLSHGWMSRLAKPGVAHQEGPSSTFPSQRNGRQRGGGLVVLRANPPLPLPCQRLLQAASGAALPCPGCCLYGAFLTFSRHEDN